MKDDTQDPLFILLVTKAFIHFGDFSVFIDKADMAHPHRDITVNKGRGSLGFNLAPAFKPKTCIIRVVRIVCDKVRERAIPCWTKSFFSSRQGWFEKHRTKGVTISRIYRLICNPGRRVNPLALIGFRNRNQCIRPDSPGVSKFLFSDRNGTSPSAISVCLQIRHLPRHV